MYTFDQFSQPKDKKTSTQFLYQRICIINIKFMSIKTD